jgi:hypothetical protein
MCEETRDALRGMVIVHVKNIIQFKIIADDYYNDLALAA